MSDAPASGPPAPQRTGTLTTQTGARTVAPMWPRPLMTDGEWAVYTALWSFGSWGGTDAFPSHQKLADRAWCERSTAANAVAKFDKLGLIRRNHRRRTNKSTTSNVYELVEVCPSALADRIVVLAEKRIAAQAVKRRARNRSKKGKSALPPAETTESDSLQEAETPGGTAHKVPPGEAKGGIAPAVPPGIAHEVPGGTAGDEPLTTPLGPSQEDQSPPTAAAAHAPRGRARADARGDPPLTDDQRRRLNEAVADAVAVRTGRTGWSAAAIAAAVETTLADGHSVDTVTLALTRLARDLGGTALPGRLPWHLALQARPGREPPGTGAVAVNYLEAGRPRCARHRDYPGDNCAQCLVDEHIAAQERSAGTLGPDTPVTAGPVTAEQAAAELAAVRARLATKTARGLSAKRRATRPQAPPVAEADRQAQLAALSAAYPDQVAVATGDDLPPSPVSAAGDERS